MFAIAEENAKTKQRKAAVEQKKVHPRFVLLSAYSIQ